MANCRDGFGGGFSSRGKVSSEMLVDYVGVDHLADPFFVAAGKEDEVVWFKSKFGVVP